MDIVINIAGTAGGIAKEFSTIIGKHLGSQAALIDVDDLIQAKLDADTKFKSAYDRSVSKGELLSSDIIAPLVEKALADIGDRHIVIVNGLIAHRDRLAVAERLGLLDEQKSVSVVIRARMADSIRVLKEREKPIGDFRARFKKSVKFLRQVGRRLHDMNLYVVDVYDACHELNDGHCHTVADVLNAITAFRHSRALPLESTSRVRRIIPNEVIVRRYFEAGAPSIIQQASASAACA